MTEYEVAHVEPIESDKIVDNRFVFRLIFRATPDDVTLILVRDSISDLRDVFLNAADDLRIEDTKEDLAFRRELVKTEFGDLVDTLSAKDKGFLMRALRRLSSEAQTAFLDIVS